MIEWFRRLADIPSVGYVAEPRINRMKLRKHDAVPTLSTYTFDGERQLALVWPLPNGSTSASPAADHSARHLQDSTTSSMMLLRRLAETLELPGTASDYHFAIQGCVEELWKRRGQEPGLLKEVERLCWLDIRLIEARPQTIASPKAGGLTYFRVLAFGHLIELYSREGFLHEALDVADRGARLHQNTPVEDLRERLDRMNAEEP